MSNNSLLSNQAIPGAQKLNSFALHLVSYSCFEQLGRRGGCQQSPWPHQIFAFSIAFNLTKPTAFQKKSVCLLRECLLSERTSEC